MAETTMKPEIKIDPASDVPDSLANIDEFDDDADLHIPPPPPPLGDGPQAWLVKVPRYIWEAWADIYRTVPDDTPVEIGKMRVYNAPDPRTLKQRTQIQLHPGVPQHVGLPKMYNLDIKTDGYSNTAVFSERDLPGTNSGANRSRRRQFNRGIPPKSDRYNQSPAKKPSGYRTSIPKQTALAPQIHHVADATPELDQSYYAHFAKLYGSSIEPRLKTKIQRGIDRSMHPGTSNLSTFSTFGMSSRPANRRKKVVKEKAVRMEERVLMDQLFACFRRYRYWGLKALKNELRQPEAYIKETLEKVAFLVRSGDFAMNYQLKPEYEATAQVKDEEVKEETAAVKSEELEESEMDLEEEEGDEDELGEDDLGEEDFEDVGMDLE